MTLLLRIYRETRRRTTAALARVWIITHPRAAATIRAERAWIFGGAVGRRYNDNSAALHRHLRAERPAQACYWVIDGDSDDRNLAAQAGPVLLRTSVSAHVRAMLAEVIVISHGIHDVPGLASARTTALRVRLGHGITATRMRRAHAVGSVERANRLFDLVPVSSAFERHNKAGWGIDPARIVVTGVPRFDTLVAKQRRIDTDPRRILYMPTWRDGTVNNQTGFEASDYARGIASLLADPALEAMLDQHEAVLHVVFHPIARPFALRMIEKNIPQSEQIAIEEDGDLQVLLARARLLVTDYSSVAWDMLYLDKPVIFFQFDRDAFAAERGSHLGGEMGWPGPVVETVPALIDTLDRSLSATCTDKALPDRVAYWKKKVFTYTDTGNCARVLGAIDDLLADGRSDPAANMALVPPTCLTRNARG